MERLEIHNISEIQSFLLECTTSPVEIYLDNVKIINQYAFYSLAPGSEIFVKEMSKPIGWDEEWCDDSVTVYWGATF